MRTCLRHAASLVALPGVVTILVPAWLAADAHLTPRLGTTPAQLAVQGVGALLLAAGLALFVWSLRRFAVDGEGTLAPWDPPARLVVRGPYRYVRNPMIGGVLYILFAEALLLRSRPHLLWAVAFLALNLVYIPFHEEPRLRRRFGDAYRDYCRHVPRIVPRVRPWGPPPGGGAA